MILQNYLLLFSRLITAFPVGFAAGYLLTERAEDFISQRLPRQKYFRPAPGEISKWKAAVRMALLSALLFSGVLFYGGIPDGLLLRDWLFFCLLFLSAYVDHFVYLIPNEGILLAILIWGLWEICSAKTFWKILLQLAVAVLFAAAILLVTVLMERRKRQQMFGRGDIKLLFLVALFLGMEKALYVLALACICGLLILLLRGPQKKRVPIAFGPCIALAGFLVMLFQRGLGA